jgi:hypothetical protein
MSHIQDLRDVIQRLHGAEAKHVESVPVVEQHQGQTVWDGVVEVFDLIGHPKTHRVYAWAHETESGKKRHVTVLHIPPVVSPQTAVRAAIIQEYRNNA